MVYHGDIKTLKKKNRYIIGVVPKWNRYADNDPGFKLLRVGVYTPAQIKLKKANSWQNVTANARSFGYRALKQVFKDQLSEKKPK